MPLVGAAAYCADVSPGVRTESDSPSSSSDGAGNDGGGVTARGTIAGDTGEPGGDTERSRVLDCGARAPGVESGGGGNSFRLVVKRCEKKPDSLFDARACHTVSLAHVDTRFYSHPSLLVGRDSQSCRSLALQTNSHVVKSSSGAVDPFGSRPVEKQV